MKSIEVKVKLEDCTADSFVEVDFDQYLKEREIYRQKCAVEELKRIQEIEEIVKLDSNNQELAEILKRRKEAYDEHNIDLSLNYIKD